MPANPGEPLRAVAGARRSVGEVLTTKEIAYFVVAPIFGISSPKYAWLNEVQSVSKMVEIKERSCAVPQGRRRRSAAGL